MIPSLAVRHPHTMAYTPSILGGGCLIAGIVLLACNWRR